MVSRPNLTALGATFAFLAVLIGAFGAHALRTILTPESKVIFETGVHYQMFHALAILFMSVWPNLDKRISAIGYLFAVGIVLFSFSLYAFAITGARILVAVTPLGGACFLVGWGIAIGIAVKR
jgi:uncharacterized membrane protein YgdD (TMEM256/DUF423 family)